MKGVNNHKPCRICIVLIWVEGRKSPQNRRKPLRHDLLYLTALPLVSNWDVKGECVHLSGVSGLRGNECECTRQTFIHKHVIIWWSKFISFFFRPCEMVSWNNYGPVQSTVIMGLFLNTSILYCLIGPLLTFWKHVQSLWDKSKQKHVACSLQAETLSKKVKQSWFNKVCLLDVIRRRTAHGSFSTHWITLFLTESAHNKQALGSLSLVLFIGTQIDSQIHA